MRKTIAWALSATALLAAAAFATSIVVSRPLFHEALDVSTLEEISVAPREQALTFARSRFDGRDRLLLVTQYRGAKLVAIDLSGRLGIEETDAVKVFREFGYDRLLAESMSAADVVTVEDSSLIVPFDAPEQNIGVGLNYREHARESNLEEPPFLFPKFAQPTHFRSAVAKGQSTLLDYEAELGLVALDDIGRDSTAAPMGLVLANEITDRWPLVRKLDRSRPMGTTGFADGKSREGFAPIGPLLVIPRDLDAFYRNIELKLYVNGRLRQHEKASAMLWEPRRIVAEVFRAADRPFAYRDGEVRLLRQGNRIPAGTIVFSGTPAGVIFKPLNLWNPWVYLQPGDEVVIRADYLGVIRNRITE